MVHNNHSIVGPMVHNHRKPSLPYILFQNHRKTIDPNHPVHFWPKKNGKLEEGSYQVATFHLWNQGFLTQKWVNTGFLSRKWVNTAFLSRKWVNTAFLSRK